MSRGARTRRRELFALHGDALYRFVRHALAGGDGAEDVVQTTLLRAYRAADRFDGRGSLRTWLWTIAWRELVRWRRRRAWLPILADRVAPSREIVRVEDLVWIDAALATLTPTLRAAFALVHVEEATVAKAATILAIPEGTVKSRVHAAKAHLRTYLEDASADPE